MTRLQEIFAKHHINIRDMWDSYDIYSEYFDADGNPKTGIDVYDLASAINAFDNYIKYGWDTFCPGGGLIVKSL